MKRSRQRQLHDNSMQAEQSRVPNQLGLDLIQRCMEVGWLKSDEELKALAGVCKALNTRIKDQVKEIHLPVSALLDLQQCLKWRQLSNPSSAAAGSVRTLVRPVTHGQSQQAGAAAAASANGAKRRAVSVTGVIADDSNGCSSARLPTSLQEHFSTRLPELGRINLYCNSVLQSHALTSQLQQLARIPQLTSLELKDSCSWSLPCAGLSSISALTALKQLQLLVQSPGMPSSASNGLGFPPVATGWQGHVTRALSKVAALTQLEHLQLRFICGERGYFMSSSLLAAVTALTRLSYLDLGYVEVKADGLASLAQLTNLACLILYGSLSALSAPDFGCLSSLRALQRLEMFHDWPPAQDDVAAEFGRRDLNDQEAQALGANLACLTKLTWLNLPMSGKSTGMLPLLRKLPALKQLYLQSIERQQVELPLASFAAAASCLKVLQVDNVRLTAQGLASIASLTQLYQLTLFNLLLDLSLGSTQCLTQLSQLSHLEQLCFDSLVSEPGGPVTAVVLDNTVLSALAPHWSNLQSLHISYAALPEAADLHLTCFTAFQKLHNLSLYCFQQAGMHQQDVVLDGGLLPPGLQSLCLSTLTMRNAHLLPKALQHVWLSDIQTADFNLGRPRTLASVISDCLHSLLTLVLRCSNPGGNPSVTTHDLKEIARGCPRLECLGVSLPEMHPDQVDLRVLAPLTRLRQLLLDYCNVDVTMEAQAPAGLAQQQQGEEPPPPAAAAVLPPPPAQVPEQQQQGGQPPAAAVPPPLQLHVPQQQQQAGQPPAAAVAVPAPPPPPMPPPPPQQQQQLVPGVHGDFLVIPLQDWQVLQQHVAGLAELVQPVLPAGLAPLPLHGGNAAAAADGAIVAAAAAEQDEMQQHGNDGEQQGPEGDDAGAVVAAAEQQPAADGEHEALVAEGMVIAAAAAGGEDGNAPVVNNVNVQEAAPGGGLPAAPQQQPQQGFPPEQVQGLEPMQVFPLGAGFGAPFQDLPHQEPDFDAQEVIQQLSELGQHTTKLQGLWLSDNVLLGAGLGLQQLLQQSMPYVTIRPAANDWFWGTNFPMGSCLNAENPMEWWKFSPWAVL